MFRLRVLCLVALFPHVAEHSAESSQFDQTQYFRLSHGRGHGDTSCECFASQGRPSTLGSCEMERLRICSSEPEVHWPHSWVLKPFQGLHP